ncbi:MAG: spermidine synthase [Thermoprotei archaeon]|nr:MAG: spermidine synthase [Thermoprotei archaeon]
MSEETSWLHFTEMQTPNTAVLHKVKRVVYRGRTRFQQVDLVETYDFGLCLILDGKLQSSVMDEWIYHEALVHPAMLTHPHPKRVVIIGGGEGATAREVLKHDAVEEVVMVDLDEEVVNLARRKLRVMHRGAFDNPKLKLLHQDGRKYLEEEEDTFDVAIIDITDPLSGGPSYLLYTKEFYDILAGKLSEDGVMVTQATSTCYSRECFTSIAKTIAATFPIARPYRAWIPSFSSEWGFVLGSKHHDPVKLSARTIAQRLRSRGVRNLKFYTPRLHRYLFSLPKFLEKALRTEGRVIRDGEPVFMPA